MLLCVTRLLYAGSMCGIRKWQNYTFHTARGFPLCASSPVALSLSDCNGFEASEPLLVSREQQVYRILAKAVVSAVAFSTTTYKVGLPYRDCVYSWCVALSCQRAPLASHVRVWIDEMAFFMHTRCYTRGSSARCWSARGAADCRFLIQPW